MSDSGKEATQMLSANPSNIHIRKIDELRDLAGEMQMPVQVAGFRIIEIAPAENESLGFDVCMGPTGTFIMISYVEPDSLVAKLGMEPGDELVSVNETSFKMITLDQAIDVGQLRLFGVSLQKFI
jgi:S1-C subfamily serine protease